MHLPKLDEAGKLVVSALFCGFATGVIFMSALVLTFRIN